MNKPYYPSEHNIVKQNMYWCFCHNLKHSLKTIIKGEVKCHVEDDMLIVTIFSTNNVIFRYTHGNIYSEIVQGFASETCTQIIYKRYKRYINNLFFL